MKKRHPEVVADDNAIIDFIRDFTIAHGHSPTLRIMAEELGYAAHSALHAKLLHLRKQKLITWQDRTPRTIRAVEQ